MKYSLRHHTRYAYSAPVFLEPHIIRLAPRHGDGIHLHRAQLEISPTPAGRFVCEEVTGNILHHAWFEGATDSLEFTNTLELTANPFNPFGYIIHPAETARMPFEYPPEFMPFLWPYLQRSSKSLAVAAFALDAARDANQETIPFISLLTARIQETIAHTIREEGKPYSPERTLKGRAGACRDLAVLMMDACRVAGLAARFVSGYVLEHDPKNTRELHAWTEVYVPGGGWRGFDPSTGLAVSSRHVPLAAADDAALAAPVQGAFRGDDVQVSLEHEIGVAVIEDYVSQGAL